MGKVLDIRGLPETRELLDSFTGNQLQNRVRVATRAGAKVLRTELRSRATDPQYPSSFRKTKTRGHRTPVGTSTGPDSPLLYIFEVGAKPHGIGKGAPNSQGTKTVLYNASEAFIARAPVKHPGMAARPIIGPVADAKQDEAAKAAMDVLFTERPPAFSLGDT